MSEKNSDIGVMISTRFGVGVNDPEWFEHRFLLFEAITASSLRAQTYQNFVWNIFVGENPFDWVTEKLAEITQGIGSKVLLHKAPQRASILDQQFSREDNKKRVLCLIDDDDGWHIDFLSTVHTLAHRQFSNGKRKVAITFPDGYEWVITKQRDIDALLKKGLHIDREPTIRHYSRPFHSMSCILIYEENTPDSFASTHSSMGTCLTPLGFELREIKCPHPMWIYARHRQADSALIKAHQFPEAKLTPDELNLLFGIPKDLVERYMKNENLFGYAIKRNHSAQNKTSMTLKLDNFN